MQIAPDSLHDWVGLRASCAQNYALFFIVNVLVFHVSVEVRLEWQQVEE